MATTCYVCSSVNYVCSSVLAGNQQTLWGCLCNSGLPTSDERKRVRAGPKRTKESSSVFGGLISMPFGVGDPKKVRANTLLFARYMLHGERTGFQMFESPCPKERSDFGERCAMAMLLDSLEPGRDKPTVKFSSVRKVRSMVTNVLKVHGDLAAPTATLRSGVKMSQLTAFLTDSVWFQAFISGMT
jgi:hypothetical protein